MSLICPYCGKEFEKDAEVRDCVDAHVEELKKKSPHEWKMTIDSYLLEEVSSAWKGYYAQTKKPPDFNSLRVRVFMNEKTGELFEKSFRDEFLRLFGNWGGSYSDLMFYWMDEKILRCLAKMNMPLMIDDEVEVTVDFMDVGSVHNFKQKSNALFKDGYAFRGMHLSNYDFSDPFAFEMILDFSKPKEVSIEEDVNKNTSFINVSF